MSKSELRKIFRDKRKALSAREVEMKSEEISQNFLENILPKIYPKNSDQVFSLYLASGNEVSTKSIARYFQQNQIRFSYPRIIAQNHALDFALYDQNTKFTTNKFYPNILEPEEGEKILPDFLIMPLVAFDADLSRLGMGGGFFDRTIEFLKKRKSQITTIGLAYDFQESREPLPLDNNDCALDFIATEKKVFSPTRT